MELNCDSRERANAVILEGLWAAWFVARASLFQRAHYGSSGDDRHGILDVIDWPPHQVDKGFVIEHDDAGFGSDLDRVSKLLSRSGERMDWSDGHLFPSRVVVVEVLPLLVQQLRSASPS